MIPLLFVAFGLVNTPTVLAQENVGITEVMPNVLVFATSAGNVVASVGNDGALLVGTPSKESTPEISRILAARTKSPVRYVVIAPEALNHSQGDAGWGRQGAFVAMQENALGRLGGHSMSQSSPVPFRLRNLEVDRPRISFSEVLSFDINGDAIHIIHQPAAYSDADSLVHFHVANLIYVGEVFPGDGYPMIDRDQGGALDGLLNMLRPWVNSKFHIVPARGNVTNGTAVKEFLDMIKVVRDRIQRMIDAGQNEQQVLAAHPTSDFDTRWGSGQVTPDTFVHEIYTALSAPKADTNQK